MAITFDPLKRERTLAERQLDFEDAVKVFGGPKVTLQDARHDYGEDRFQTIGYLDDKVVMVVWTPRGSDRHVFSMRRCNEREIRKFNDRLR